MMRDFSSHLDRGRRTDRPVLRRLILGVVALIIVLWLLGELLGGVFTVITRPFFLGARAVENELSATWSALFADKQALVDERDELKASLEAERALLLRYRTLEAENAELKSLWDRRAYESTVLAAVLSRPSLTPYDTFLIDVGEGQVEVGDYVIAGGSTAIGTVAEVYGHAALVSLFSTPRRETQVLIGVARVPAIARGEGGGAFIAELPRGADVGEGAPVLMPGLTSHVFAEVEAVEGVDTALPVLTVRFTIPINLFGLTWVEVLKNEAELPERIDLPPLPEATTTPQDVGIEASGTTTP